MYVLRIFFLATFFLQPTVCDPSLGALLREAEHLQPQTSRDGVLSNLLQLLGKYLLFPSTTSSRTAVSGGGYEHERLAAGDAAVSPPQCPDTQCREESGRPLTCGSLAHWRLQGRIVNGSTVEVAGHPWAVRVLHRGRMFCSGSLVTATFVVSAAHCFHRAKPQDFLLKLGRRARWVERNIERLFVRSDFVRSTYDNDIALIRMDRAVMFSSYVRPVCLPATVSDLTGRRGAVVGWGKLSQRGQMPHALQEVELPVLPVEECRASRHPATSITDNMFCAGFMDGRADACQGDSGGGFVVEGGNGVGRGKKLVGIVSWGIGCASPGYPGVYTNLAVFLPWLVDVIATNGSCVCGQE